MIARFCAYSALRNLRFFEPFLVLFLLHDVGLTFLAVGALLAYEKVLCGLLEVPLGVVNDRFGRRRGLVAAFVLTALAFGAFAGATQAPDGWKLVLLYGAQTLYAVGEALRTGTHKAMILDWLQRQGRRDEKTRVMGITRFWSKSSGGVSALAAGVLVWTTGSFTLLFVAACLPTLAAAVVVWSYPRELEGMRAATPAAEATPRPRLAGLVGAGVVPMLLASVVFESQVKLALVYLQPFLAGALGTADLAVMGGVGAMVFGGWYFVQGLLAGASSLGATWLVARAGSEARALRAAHRAAALGMVGVVVGLSTGWQAPALVCFLAFAALQNARRPIFVSALDDVMDPAYRATTLSIESQARSWAYAGSAVVMGALADAGGLVAAFAGMAALLALVVVRLPRLRGDAAWLTGDRPPAT
ncbi:MAG: MFS transporter [Myxococcales bacterium]|nr:MFS transporter [Myxococcales bacterium]